MPALLLQKPSKKSKTKDHLIALDRRLILWENGNLDELLSEAETIQKQLTAKPNEKSNIKNISKEFVQKMQKGNVNGAIKILTNNMSNGVLPLTDETLEKLREKHPSGKKADEDVLLTDTPETVHPIRFEEIDGDSVRLAAIRTNGGAGPSGMDGEGWRRILTSKQFGQDSIDLCGAVAKFAKSPCIELHSKESIEAFI